MEIRKWEFLKNFLAIKLLILTDILLFKLLANPNLKFVRVYALISKPQNYRERLRGSAPRYLEQELGLFYLFLVFLLLQVQHR
jgi:hypothetical protein